MAMMHRSEMKNFRMEKKFTNGDDQQKGVTGRTHDERLVLRWQVEDDYEQPCKALTIGLVKLAIDERWVSHGERWTNNLVNGVL
ncbi:unnamed protein product [Citrullus colocynthis]|uniref:Uncharacterized protein n=1 Tax=Citrullus colocynthis TaxID=252529 RepID=A0ABP0Y4W7_9ROSI